MSCATNETIHYPTYTTQDIERAAYCGYSLYDDDLDSTTEHNVSVYCNTTGQNYTVTCANTTGEVEFTCPSVEATGSCDYWDCKCAHRHTRSVHTLFDRDSTLTTPFSL